MFEQSFLQRLLATHLGHAVIFTIRVDKHAFYLTAFSISREGKILSADCKLNRMEYPNNIIEQITDSPGGG